MVSPAIQGNGESQYGIGEYLEADCGVVIAQESVAAGHMAMIRIMDQPEQPAQKIILSGETWEMYVVDGVFQQGKVNYLGGHPRIYNQTERMLWPELFLEKKP